MGVGGVGGCAEGMDVGLQGWTSTCVDAGKGKELLQCEVEKDDDNEEKKKKKMNLKRRGRDAGHILHPQSRRGI